MPGRVRRRYKVKGLTDRGADHMVFHNEQADKDMSVASYYASQYNYQCAWPDVLPAFARLLWFSLGASPFGDRMLSSRYSMQYMLALKASVGPGGKHHNPQGGMAV